MKIYFDGVQLNDDYIMELTQTCNSFDTSFKLGSTPCNTFVLGLDSSYSASNPSVVTLNYNNSLYATLRVVDKQINGSMVEYTLEDNMTLFEFNYSAKTLIQNNGGTVTIKQILQDICSKAGVTLANTSWVNDNIQVGIYDNTYTARQYIGFIAELNGGYARINESGQLELKQYSNTSVNDISLEECSDYLIGEEHTISKVIYDNGLVHYESSSTRSVSQESLYINSDNPYIGNQSILDTIANVIVNFRFYSLRVDNAPINGSVKCGDTITFTYNSEEYPTIAQIEYNYSSGWNGGYSLSLESSEQTETSVSQRDSEYKRLKVSQDLTDGSLKIISEVTIPEQNDKIAAISLKYDELIAQISDIADITTSAEDTDAQVELDNVNESEPIYIKIHPTSESISYLYPNNSLYPSNTLFSTNRIIRFTNTTTNETFDWELPTDLWYYNSETYDELVMSYDDQEVIVTRKCKINADGTISALATPTTETYDFPNGEINLTSGNYQVSLLGYNNGYLFVRLMASNIYTTQFATKAELNSQIKQTAQSIDLSVNQKLSSYSTTSEMNSAIQLSSSNITSTVAETYATKTTTNSMQTQINQKASSIELTASDDSTSCGITVKLKDSSGNELDSKSANVTMSGLVKFTDLSNAGSTTINGSNITTGTINCGLLNGGTISGQKISGGTISGTTVTGGSINISSGKFKVTSDGAVTASNIGITGGSIKSTSFVLEDTSAHAAIALKSASHGIMCGYYTGRNSDGLVTKNLRYTLKPFTAGGQLMMYDENGTGKAYFDQSGAHSSSDIRLKNNISNIKEETSMNLISSLDPIEYTYKSDETKYHRGLSAQQVEEVLHKNNIDKQVYEINENGEYSLNYVELIPDLINCIKHLQKEIEELKKEKENTNDNI